MRFHRCSLLTIAAAAVWSADFASADDDWCDERCPDYDKCKDRRVRRNLETNRTLHQVEHLFLLNDKESNGIHNEGKKSNAGLRGGAGATNVQRKLESRHFHLKLYHEESEDYCWQGEWKDRRWCIDSDGDSFGVGEEVEIRECNEDKDDQQFVYEEVSGSGGGRIRPYEKQELCLKRASPAEFRRKITCEVCDVNSYTDDEIFFGFTFHNKFKIVPKTLDDHCLTQHHHPRAGERIYAGECEDACEDGTCFWETIYDSGGGESSPTDTPSTSPGDPPVQDNGSSYCTQSYPCGQCEGDCDYDYECAGDLVCCKREDYDPVPTCTGGEYISNSRDFCVPPQYESQCR